jgi:hypothetical protein
VIMRKQPFSTPGRRRNVLLMNESGVLVDRTDVYAVASSVAGDEGFLTPTNDRHSVIADLNDDGWRDVVTATAYGSGLAKAISHPRVYMNLGQAPGGGWQGLRYEEPRIPTLPQAPNTCQVAAGDVTGNGVPDLYFVTYSSTLNDFLLVNNGTANFTNETSSRVPSQFAVSSFGTACAIVDLNGSGWRDICKSENGPFKIAYNAGNGMFTSWHQASSGSHYHMSVADLNNNGRWDIIITDDGQDRVLRNQGPNSQGQATFVSVGLPEQSTSGGGTGFGGNSVAADLNNDGWKDILIADVDVDASGCGRFSNIYRNNANGPNVTFARDLSNIPQSMLQGVFDFAVFDINGNGWADIVAGRCSGTQVWMNQPVVNMAFNYPAGHPGTVTPNEPASVQVQLSPTGGEVTGAVMYVAVDGGAFVTTPLVDLGLNTFVGEIPAMACGSRAQYYFEATLTGGHVFKDPASAPASSYGAIAATGSKEVFSEEFEGDVAGWTVVNDPSLTGGAWVRETPVVTISGGLLASPDGDASPDPNGMAFITGNCLPGQAAGACDVDHGPTRLISPVFDLSQFDAVIRYDRWFFCSTQDELRVDFLFTEVSNNGGTTWVPVHQTLGTGGEWETVSFLVGAYVTPTANVRVRFWTRDENNNSITNAVIDNLVIERVLCGDETCTGDLNGDGAVDVFDLLDLLGAWGACAGCAADINGDGAVDVFDLLELLGAWGACP